MMRLNVSRAAAVLIAAFTVAACGTQHSGPSGTGKNPPPEPAAFVTRAQQVTAQWNGSRAAHDWQNGLVLQDASDLVPLPPNAGFSSQRQKGAFTAGDFRLATTLPSQPLGGEVRWASGATLHLPLLSAKAAFAELATQRRCGAPDPCSELTVTGVQPDTVTVATSRGPASVPAWRFTVAGLSWRASEVAVAPSALAAIPRSGPIPVAGQNTPGVSELEAVSADGRTLTLIFYTGACATAWGAYSHESAQTVVVGSWSRDSTSSGMCGASAAERMARVRLTRPLGPRVVLDVASGQPLMRRLWPSPSRPLCTRRPDGRDHS